MIIRNKQLEQVWLFTIERNMFETVLFIKGTESEVLDYINSELPNDNGRYHAITEDEIKLLEKLNIKIYIAPKK